MKREQGNQTLGFSSRPFVLCGLPVRRPTAGELLYERRNGQFVLQVTGHPDFGLPFGQDRLVPIFLATLAVRQQSQTMRFESAARDARHLRHAEGRQGVSPAGRGLRAHLRRDDLLRYGLCRSHAPESCTARRFNFLREARIWYSRGTEVPSGESENVIVLSDEFYAEVMAHPIPTDLEAVKVLAAAPGVLDLFMWLAYRCYVAKGPERIPFFGEFGLAHQLGSVEYSRPRRFRAMLEQWLATIRVMWPECPAKMATDGRNLEISPAEGVRRAQLESAVPHFD